MSKELLEEEGRQLFSADLLFPNSVGGVCPENVFQQHIWKPTLAVAKVPYLSPHTMRHTCATQWLDAGAHEAWVQKQLGHATQQETTDTYGSSRVGGNRTFDPGKVVSYRA